MNAMSELSRAQEALGIPREDVPWTPEQRCEIARRHLMKTARDWERIPEAHQALMIAVDSLDHAVESAK